MSLTVENLSYAYGSRRALDDVSFDLPPGRFCALLGPNGAGKSTLFALLTRLLAAPEGRIEIAGHDLASTPRAALARLGVVFQQPTLDLDLTVAQNMAYFAALHGIPRRTARIAVDAALDRAGLADRAGERARSLSGGQRRRVEIARALIHDPAVLLLDEPTVGIDAAARAAITSHAHDLAAEGRTVLWATHLTDEVRHDDTLIILHQGRVLETGICSDICAGTPLTDLFLSRTGGVVA